MFSLKIVKRRGVTVAFMLSLLVLTFAVAIPIVSAYETDSSWQVATSVDAVPSTKMIATVTTTNDWEWEATFRWYGPYGTQGEVDALVAAATPQTSLTPAYTTVDTHSGDPQTTFVSEVSIGLPDLGYWYVEAECSGIEGGTVYPHIAFASLALVEPVPWFTDLPLALLATVGVGVLLRRKGYIARPV